MARQKACVCLCDGTETGKTTATPAESDPNLAIPPSSRSPAVTGSQQPASRPQVLRLGDLPSAPVPLQSARVSRPLGKPPGGKTTRWSIGFTQGAERIRPQHGGDVFGSVHFCELPIPAGQGSKCKTAADHGPAVLVRNH